VTRSLAKALTMMTQLLEGFSEGSMGADIHPYPEGEESGLMDVSQANTKFFQAPAAGPYEYDLAKIQQFV